MFLIIKWRNLPASAAIKTGDISELAAALVARLTDISWQTVASVAESINVVLATAVTAAVLVVTVVH